MAVGNVLMANALRVLHSTWVMHGAGSIGSGDLGDPGYRPKLVG